jgi:hypothetical protein
MSTKFLIIRHELADNAINSINTLYADKIADIQKVKDGDGQILKAIHWGVYTPEFIPYTVAGSAQWVSQEITLELRASVDYQDRTLDSRYLQLLQVFEDFGARDDLKTQLSGVNVLVDMIPDVTGGSEEINDGKYVTTYRIKVSARERLTGE